jgi:L-fuculose-phosphate aldolase
MDFEQLHPADKIAAVMGRVYSSGLTTTSGGNISIRDADGSIWITPGGVDKGSLTSADIVRVMPDGSVEGKHTPSIELPFHSKIYKVRPDVRAVLHAHPPALVAYSIVGKAPEVRLIPGARELCGEVGFAPYAPPGSIELGEKIAETFARGAKCVMLENHGAAAAGGCLTDAFRAFEMLDYCARVGIDAAALGGASPLSEEELALASKTPGGAGMELAPEHRTTKEEDARKLLSGIVRRACAKGLFLSSMGEFSVRLPGGGFLITADGADRLTADPDGLVRMQGGLHEAGKRPGRTAALHGSIYEAQPHVNAVAVAHPAGIMAFAVSGRALDTRMIPESYALLRGMPLLPFGAMYPQPENAAGLFAMDNPVALVRSACVVSTGAGALQAFDRLEVAEFSARAVLLARGLGDITMMEGEKLTEIERIFKLQ